MQKPLPQEHNPYFRRYIDLVKEGNYADLLHNNTTTAVHFFETLPVDKHNYRYAEGKWSIKEVLMHIMDTERVMSYRALAAARGDNKSSLPSMDENNYAANADVTNRTMQDLLEEFKAIRTATAKLFLNMTESQTILLANVAGFPTSARALGYVIIGHVQHHLTITKERYL